MVSGKNTTLTQHRLKELLHYEPETGVFTWKVDSRDGGRGHRSGDTAGTLAQGYTVIRVGKVVYKAHRLAWLYVHGSFPEHEIDHVDGKPSGTAGTKACTFSKVGGERA